MNFRGTFDEDQAFNALLCCYLTVHCVLLCAGPEQYYERAQTPFIVPAAHTHALSSRLADTAV